MEVVNNQQAKTQLSRLIDRVAGGGAVIITKAGKPVAKIVPLSAPDVKQVNRLGFMTGELALNKNRSG